MFNNARNNGRHRCLSVLLLSDAVNRRRLQSVHTRTFRPCHETPEEWGGCSHRGPLRRIVRLLVSRDGVGEGLMRWFPTASSFVSQTTSHPCHDYGWLSNMVCVCVCVLKGDTLIGCHGNDVNLFATLIILIPYPQKTQEWVAEKQQGIEIKTNIGC